MKYGRIINGKFEYQSKIIINGDVRIINPKEEDYIKAGYKPVVTTERPQKEGYYYTSKFVDNGDVITQEWEEHEVVDEDLN